MAHGRNARPLRCAAISVPRARRRSPIPAPMAPYRGVSRPVITFALERLMDKAAAAFGIDPIEIRRRNLIDKFPYTSATGLVFDEAPTKRRMEMAVKAIDLPAFRARQKQARAQGPPSRDRLCDVFRAHRLWQPGLRRARHGDHARLGNRASSPSIPPASSRRASAPRRTARACAPRWRRSSPTKSASTPQLIKVVHGDTDRAPYGWGTFASRSLVISGGASLIAARKMRAKLIKIASHMLEAAAGRHRAGGRHRRRSPAPTARSPIATHGARRLSPDPSLQGRDRARPDRDRHLRSAGHVLQCLPCRHRRGRRRDRPRRRSRNSWWPRTPAASSIR